MNSIICRYAIWVRTVSSCEGRVEVVITGGLETGAVGEVFLVERTFCRSWQRCPFAVAIILGQCFLTRAAVSPGHVVKKPAVIVVVHYDATGLKAALWRYCMISALMDEVCTLLEHGES